MGIDVRGSNLHATSILNDVVTTGAQLRSSAVDVSAFEGPLLFVVSFRSGGANSAATTIVECDTSGGTYAAIPAAALVNPDTGAADTFDAVVAGGGVQVMAVLKEYCKRYLKVSVDGTSITQNVAASVVATKKYSAD